MTAPRPTRPQPKTAQTEPGSTRAVKKTAPMPVDSPHANGAQPSSGASGLTFASAISGMTVYSANVDVPMKCLQRIAAAAESRRAVREQAEPLLVANRDAAVRPVAEAMDALAALRSEQRHDVVALGDERHPLADALDDAGALVAEHARHVAARDPPRTPCRGRCGRRRRRRAGRAPRLPSAPPARRPGRRAAARTPPARRREPSSRTAQPYDPRRRCRR